MTDRLRIQTREWRQGDWDCDVHAAIVPAATGGYCPALLFDGRLLSNSTTLASILAFGEWPPTTEGATE